MNGRKPQHQYRYQQLRPRVLLRDNYQCHWCGTQLRRPGSDVGAPPHVDHVVPVALGGAPFDMANMVAACQRCNLSKGSKLLAGRRRLLAAGRFLSPHSCTAPQSGFLSPSRKARKRQSRAW